jgi:hypothetical protein
MSALLDRLPAEQRGRVRPVAHGAAGRVAEQPMLAVLGDRRSFDDGWVFERKLERAADVVREQPVGGPR